MIRARDVVALCFALFVCAPAEAVAGEGTFSHAWYAFILEPIASEQATRTCLRMVLAYDSEVCRGLPNSPKLAQMPYISIALTPEGSLLGSNGSPVPTIFPQEGRYTVVSDPFVGRSGSVHGHMVLNHGTAQQQYIPITAGELVMTVIDASHGRMEGTYRFSFDAGAKHTQATYEGSVHAAYCDKIKTAEP